MWSEIHACKGYIHEISIFIVWDPMTCPVYHIRPKFRGTQFSRIAISEHFAETIFRGSRILSMRYPKISRVLIFEDS